MRWRTGNEISSVYSDDEAGGGQATVGLELVQTDAAYLPADLAYVAWLDDTGLAVTSKRSAFMTLTQARTKSRTNFCSWPFSA